MRLLLAPLSPLLRARRGVAAIEFAIVLPLLILILASVADLTNAMLMWWQAAQAADAIGRIATSLAVSPSNLNVLTQMQATTASTAALPLLPSLRNTVSPRAGVVLTSVVFTPTQIGCTQACTYVANVAWSATLQGGLPARPCGKLTAVADSARPSPTTLATSAFTADSMLLVDVSAEFAPVLTGLLASSVRITAAGLIGARSLGPGDWIRITGPTASLVQCKGYT